MNRLTHYFGLVWLFCVFGSRQSIAVIVAAALCLLAVPVSAQLTVFDRDFGGWRSAIGVNGVVTTIDFDDIAIPDGQSFTTLDPNHYSNLPGRPTIAVTPDDEAKGRQIIIHNNRGEEVPTSPPNAMGINDDHGTTVTIEFEQPISAMGGYFLDVEPRGVASTGFDTDANGSPEVRFSSAPGDYSQAFLGFVIDPPVNSVDIHYATTCLPIGDPTCGDGISIDDLSYAIQASPIPNNIFALHEGANDPLTEGWKRERPFGGIDTFPVIDDAGTGFDAWAIDDNMAHGPSEGLYVAEFTPEQIQQAMERGWKLSARIRVTDASTPFGVVVAGFATDSEGFGFGVGAEDDGSPLIQSAGVIIDLDDFHSGYHLYELIFDASDEEAELFADGSSILSGIESGSVGLANQEVWFGSSSSDFVGQGNYNLVKFEILPELINLIVDIKPGSDPNSVNLKSRGVLPVAVVSTDDFDVADLDVSSFSFGDPLLIDAGGMPVSPIRTSFEDVNSDGLLDLSLKFNIADMIENGVLGPSSQTGLLMAMTTSGQAVSGTDFFRIVPTPEPASLTLAVFALVFGYAKYGRRKNR